jgi:hypothetical protein
MRAASDFSPKKSSLLKAKPLIIIYNINDKQSHSY